MGLRLPLWLLLARQGHPLHLPGHGDQGTFNAIAALLNKGADFHALPEATWCDSAQTSCVAVRAVTTEGRLEVWNVTQSAPQRLVHNTGPKWWTDSGRQHLQRFGDKLKCFEHFAKPATAMVQNGQVGENGRVLVGVCSCRRHAGKRAAIRETWAQAVPAHARVVFFVGEGAEPCEEETWQLRCPDTYETLPGKVQTFFQRALQQPDWEHVFKCDDDTYVVLERLVRLLGSGEFIGNAVVTAHWCSEELLRTIHAGVADWPAKVVHAQDPYDSSLA